MWPLMMKPNQNSIISPQPQTAHNPNFIPKGVKYQKTKQKNKKQKKCGF